MRRYIAILFILFASATAVEAASGPLVKAYCDKKAIFVGDRIKYEITVSSGRPCSVEFPVHSDYRIGDFEIKDSGRAMKKGLFGGESVTAWYSITCYLFGNHTIPEAEVTCTVKGEKPVTLKAPAIEITVASLASKEKAISDIRDIKGPIGFKDTRGIIILAGLIILGSAAAFMIYRKIASHRPVKLAHETALEELEAIAAYLARTGDVKGYFVQVSDCIRHYIEHAFRLKAEEMTTEEFFDSVRDSDALSPEHKESLRGFLTACDLVKFAKYSPKEGEAASVLENARKFITETKDAEASKIGTEA